MKYRLAGATLAIGLLPVTLLAAPYPVPAPLALNQMATISAPAEKATPANTPKRLYQRYLSSSPYLTVARFTVTPGQKYTLYECVPAPPDSGTGTKIGVWMDGVTPLTDNTSSFGETSGVVRGFATRGQSPWPITANESAKCDLYRHNFTIAPNSEHNSLYIVATFNKPKLSTQVMLKTPADADAAVEKSSARSKGSVWHSPLLLLNVPGETPTAGTDTQPTQPNTTTSPQGNIQIPDAPTTADNTSPALAYPSTVKAYIQRGDYDTFRVEFPGGKFTVSSQGGLDIVADLWDDKGNRLARAGDDAKADFTLTQADLPAGIYYLQVRYMYHAGEGNYSMVLGDGGNATYQEQK
ncbi:MAG: hypothetical protein PHE17_10925 [Thiothrix sp.]|uniref:hypothetical protein n=1 Tax=Thiothrix sp. TaxID=1032 RepID=UPI002617812D|nr:hypothetical protein [Thiothrix sp.]MDD5393519.1 hypothetical protein [Thiothrix sp.]